jgi:hypothetical protein
MDTKYKIQLHNLQNAKLTWHLSCYFSETLNISNGREYFGVYSIFGYSFYFGYSL